MNWSLLKKYGIGIDQFKRRVCLLLFLAQFKCGVQHIFLSVRNKRFIVVHLRGYGQQTTVLIKWKYSFSYSE